MKTTNSLKDDKNKTLEGSFVHVCQFELSKDTKEKVFKIFFKYFLLNDVGSDEFLNEMFELTGRKIVIHDNEKIVLKKHPLSFLFFFTLTKCHFEVNWLDIFNYKMMINDDKISFIENVCKPFEMKATICFNDEHLLYRRKDKKDICSTLIRVEENTFILIRLLENLRLEFRTRKDNSETKDPVFHHHSLSQWIKKIEGIVSATSASSKVPKIYNFTFGNYRIRSKFDATKEIISYGMCEDCNVRHLPVSALDLNKDYFIQEKTSEPSPKKMKSN